MHNKSLLLFGATGDLAQRKIYDALLHLHKQGELKDTEVLGLSRRDWSDRHYHDFITQTLKDFGYFHLHKSILDEFYNQTSFQELNFGDIDNYKAILQKLEDSATEKVFVYLSIPPKFYTQVLADLQESGIAEKYRDKLIIIVEKPFGHDLVSAQELQSKLLELVDEEQIYRVDHVLDRDTLQNIIDFKQKNLGFKHLFTKQAIKNVQIIYSETLGMEGRGSFYEQTGAIRDMVQSHLLQMLSMTLLTEDFSPAHLRSKRAEILQSLTVESTEHIVRGQYESGNGHPGYREEEEIANDSEVETFVALELNSSLEQWQEVPLYIKTGKRLDEKYVDIHLVFEKDNSNLLSMRIHPYPGINFRMQLKDEEPVDLSYCYRQEQIVSPYVNVFKNVLQEQQQYFANSDEVMASWELIDEVRELMQESVLHGYAAASTGPQAADKLLEKDDVSWVGNDISAFCKIK